MWFSCGYKFKLNVEQYVVFFSFVLHVPLPLIAEFFDSGQTFTYCLFVSV